MDVSSGRRRFAVEDREHELTSLPGVNDVSSRGDQSDLHVRLTAGNIYIEDIRGNKEIFSSALPDPPNRLDATCV